MSSPPNKLKIVTTSWDDGNPNDLKIAELLHSKGLAGTFYVPFQHEAHPVIDAQGIRSLRQAGFEIGGHTISHVPLARLSSDEIDREVQGCKQKLEDILGERISFFGYPYGRFNQRVKRRLQMAGYEGARTTRMLAIAPNFDAFAMGTTLHAYPHSASTYARNLGRAINFSGLYTYARRAAYADSWVDLGRMLFDTVLKEGGVWHLYGHSWEIERCGLWEALSELLDYVACREDVHYVSNCEALSLARGANTVPSAGKVFRVQ